MEVIPTYRTPVTTEILKKNLAQMEELENNQRNAFEWRWTSWSHIRGSYAKPAEWHDRLPYLKRKLLEWMCGCSVEREDTKADIKGASTPLEVPCNALVFIHMNRHHPCSILVSALKQEHVRVCVCISNPIQLLPILPFPYAELFTYWKATRILPS